MNTTKRDGATRILDSQTTNQKVTAAATQLHATASHNTG